MPLIISAEQSAPRHSNKINGLQGKREKKIPWASSQEEHLT
jgi:hypothetical protein